MYQDGPDAMQPDSNSDKYGKTDFIPILSQLISSHEDWLMDRILFYAKRQGYAYYTSTLKEAWRLSISGLSVSMLKTLARHPDLELGPDEDFMQDPAAAFGLVEAKAHRQRGISLPMFLGLMKYYRQSYQDLIAESELGPGENAQARIWVDRFFDRVEIAFCSAWTAPVEEDRLVELQTANRRITNEKNKYLTVFESIATAAILLDDDLRILNLNRAAAQLFRLQTTPGAHYYQDFQNDAPVFPNDSLPSALEFLREQLFGELVAFNRSEETMREFEKSIDAGAGERFFNVRLSRLLDVSDKYNGTVVILEDLTEWKKIGDELASKERFLENILNAIQDGISVLDGDLNIMRVNAAMNRIHADAVPLEGKKCFEAYYCRSQPCDKCPTLRAVDSGMLESEEVMVRQGDNSPAYLEVFAFPMADDQGRIVGAVDYIRNVTARKLAEQAVRDHDRQYRNLFESCQLPILIIDPRTAVIVEANSAACRFYGYTHEDLTHLGITDINVLGKKEVLREMHLAMSQGREYFSFRHRLSDNEIRDVEVFSGPIPFEGRTLLCSFVLDVTERKILEEESLQRSKLEAVLEIAGAVCHELNQPLMALGGYHELIRFNLDEQSSAKKYLVKAHKQAQRIADLTSRLMCITRYETRDYIGGKKILDIEKSAESPVVKSTSDE